MKTEQISVRLAIAFSLLIVLLIVIGALGLGQMARINHELEEISDRRWAKADLVREALDYSNQNNRVTMEIFFLEDKAQIEPLLLQREKNTEKINAIVQKLESQIESDRERELLGAVEKARAPYISSYLRGMYMLLGRQRYADARANMVQETLPLLIAYHDAWRAFEEFQGNEVSQAINASKSRYVTIRRLTLLSI